jgi:long-subunit acyl-CoA synthetase (AMP-forming)
VSIDAYLLRLQFVTLNCDRFVVAAPLEDQLVRSRFIAQAFVFGDNKPYTIAIIVPDFIEVLYL